MSKQEGSKDKVYIILDDTDKIIDIFSSKKKAKDKYEELNSSDTRDTFFYKIIEMEVH